MRRILLVAACVVTASSISTAHELRPAYLNLFEQSPGEYAVLWKTPMRGDARLALDIEFSGETTTMTDVTTEARSSAAIQQWTIRAPNLRGQSVRVRGLESTMTDVLVQIDFADGTTWSHLLTPRAPSAMIPTQISRSNPSAAPSQPSLWPLFAALAAWTVMCGAARATRLGIAAITGAAYPLGIFAAFFLLFFIVELFPIA